MKGKSLLLSKMTRANFVPRNISEALQDHDIFFWLDSEYTMNSIKLALKALCHNNEEKIMLMCVASRREIIQIRQIVNIIDAKAFVIIEDAREVYGKGFKKQ